MTRLERIATLLAYPDAAYAARARESAEVLGLAPIREFADTVADLPTAELQEQFVATFDLDPDCAPDLGWHLFGDRYERGEWLARLRADLRRLGVGAETELPDHLTNVLTILARDEGPRVEALARDVEPAIEKLQAGLERRGSPFRHVLMAVRLVLAAATPAPQGAGHV